MNNPTRRNRNIGTSKQGHGQNNKLVIPEPNSNLKSYYERIGDYQKIVRTINGHDFVFIIEKTRSTSAHACSIDDIAMILNYIPQEDYGDLKFIVFRQPKRKEEIVTPVWGRLIYSYEFENDFSPAIILESFDTKKKIKWPKKLKVSDQKEFERLKKDGHNFIENNNNFIADLKLEFVRNTQLYRTVLHEFGHYVHYLNVVVKPANKNENINDWEKREEIYYKIPKIEKEVFADQYAEKLKNELINKKIIPYDRI